MNTSAIPALGAPALPAVPWPLLVLDASSAAGSIAIFQRGTLIAHTSVSMGASHEDLLFPAVQQLLANASVAPGAIGAILCGEGPGSFTSLRIAGALAKGLAFASGIPLFAESSLALAAATIEVAGEFLVHADALRGERYTVAVTVNAALQLSVTGPVQRVAFDDLPLLAGGRRRVAVSGSPRPDDEFRMVAPDASQAMRCLDWQGRGAVSLDAWEPAYGRLAEAQVKWEQSHGRALTEG